MMVLAVFLLLVHVALSIPAYAAVWSGRTVGKEEVALDLLAKVAGLCFAYLLVPYSAVLANTVGVLLIVF